MSRQQDEHLQDMIDQAAEAGARKVLAEIGLDNGNASRDVRDIRDLLASWRSIKQTALQTLVRMMTTALLLSLLLGAAIKLKLLGGE